MKKAPIPKENSLWRYYTSYPDLNTGLAVALLPFPLLNINETKVNYKTIPFTSNARGSLLVIYTYTRFKVQFAAL